MKAAFLLTAVAISLLMFNKTGEESSAGTKGQQSMSSSAMMKIKLQDR